jgi:hypothetical protein
MQAEGDKQGIKKEIQYYKRVGMKMLDRAEEAIENDAKERKAKPIVVEEKKIALGFKNRINQKLKKENIEP